MKAKTKTTKTVRRRRSTVTAWEAKMAQHRLDDFVMSVARGWFAASPPAPPVGQVQEYADDPRSASPHETAKLIVANAVALRDAVDDALGHAQKKTASHIETQLLNPEGKYVPEGVLTSENIDTAWPGSSRSRSHWKEPVDPQCPGCSGKGTVTLSDGDTGKCGECHGSGLRVAAPAPQYYPDPTHG